MSYKCLTKNNAKVGDVVFLINPSPHYIIGEANPVVCSQYECYGIITSIQESRISVEWDNGTRNGYMDNELALIKYKKDIQAIKQNIWNIRPIVVDTENGKYISIW